MKKRADNKVSSNGYTWPFVFQPDRPHRGRKQAIEDIRNMSTLLWDSSEVLIIDPDTFPEQITVINERKNNEQILKRTDRASQQG